MKRLIAGCLGFLCVLSSHGWGAEVTITSEPVLTARVGEMYEYDVDAISSEPGDEIEYELRGGPDGMTIDSETGLIHWLSETTGSFEIEIRAQGESSGSGSGHDDQEYILAVLNGEPGSVSGFVENLAGDGIADVRLRLFEISTGHFLFTTRSDSAGNYAFAMVDPGSYYLRISPDDSSGLGSQWYDRVTRIQDATQIDVAEHADVSIDVTLLPDDSADVRYTLSGNVSDTTGMAIAGASVYFFRARHFGDFDDTMYNFEGLDDEDRNQDLERIVTTDSLGNYVATLKPRTYILLALAEGNGVQFWDHRTNPLEADRMHLGSDTSGIDFDLIPLAGGTGSIGGLITAAPSPDPVRAHVVGLHKETPDGGFSGFVMQSQTEPLGVYRLAGLRTGFYVVLAIPQDDFLPTFYDGLTGTTQIENALPVPVAGGIVEGIDIQVYPDTISGMNRICGTVSSDNASVAGAIVYLVSHLTNEVAAAAVTDQYGGYSIVGLAPGSYTVSSSKPGYESSAGTTFDIQYHADLPTSIIIPLSILQLSASTGDGGSVLPVGFELYGNYPNPFNPTTTIRFAIPSSGLVRLVIYDILGEELATVLKGTLEAGKQSVLWDARNSRGEIASTGVYYYRVEYGGTLRMGKMVFVR